MQFDVDSSVLLVCLTAIDDDNYTISCRRGAYIGECVSTHCVVQSTPSTREHGFTSVPRRRVRPKAQVQMSYELRPVQHRPCEYEMDGGQSRWVRVPNFTSILETFVDRSRRPGYELTTPRCQR